MKGRAAVVFIICGLALAQAAAEDRSWENPIFDSADQAAAAANEEARRLGPDSPASVHFFVDAAQTRSGTAIDVIDQLLVSHPTAMLNDTVQRRTVDRFKGEIGRQSRIIRQRLNRFGFPTLDGLAYCRLVDSVDAFSNLNQASSDRMSRVGGVTYYCRYVVLPLSYVGADNIRELRNSAAFNPGMDVDATLRQWQRESYASLVSTYRHELVHVHTNSAIGLPDYSDRARYPTWFHEGTATYLAGDPHSGLSARYKTYQKTFFYLVQRYGVSRLRDFFAAAVGGQSTMGALEAVYGITESEDLFRRSGRWHHLVQVVFTGFWIAGLLIVVAAFRGKNIPVVGALLVLVSLSFVFAVATGVPQHLAGLRGPAAVLAVQVAFAAAVVLIGVKGVKRILRWRTGAAG